MKPLFILVGLINITLSSLIYQVIDLVKVNCTRLI